MLLNRSQSTSSCRGYLLIVALTTLVCLISVMCYFCHFFNFVGGGVEPESHYPQWKRVNQNIERYTALNDSIAKLAEGMYMYQYM